MPDRLMFSRSAATVLIASTTVLGALNAAYGATAAGQLVPHRAIYEMRLGTAGTSSGITSLTGRMVFEFRGSRCEGYTQSMRLVTKVTSQSGGASISDLRTSSWEEGTGKKFRFNATTLRDSKISEVSSGNAVVNRDRTLAIDLIKPKKNRLSIEGPVMFPVQHTIALLSAARSGKRILQAKVYDGSENGKKIYATTSVLGNRIAPGEKSASQDDDAGQGLGKLNSWPVSISYFEADDKKNEGLPIYQMSFRFFENGVTRDLKIDYGNFSIDGTLARVEYFDEPACGAPDAQ